MLRAPKGLSAMLRAPKAVGCARNGDHVLRVVMLQGAVSIMGFELVSFRFNIYCSDKYCTPLRQ